MSNEENDNFKHIAYLLDTYDETVKKYISDKCSRGNIISELESANDKKHRLNYQYNPGDLTWYVPPQEKNHKIPPFLIIRCAVLDYISHNLCEEYIIDEPVHNTIQTKDLYFKLENAIDALERYYCNYIKQTSLKHTIHTNTSYNKLIESGDSVNFVKSPQNIAYENFDLSLSNIVNWRNSLKHMAILKNTKNLINVSSKQEGHDWFSITHFLSMRLIYSNA